jgi:S-adenosylmethionine uptake transporter
MSIDGEGKNALPAGTMRSWEYARGVLWFLLSLVLCQCNDVVTKYLSSLCGPMQITFLRFSCATLVLVPVLLAEGRRSLATRHFPLHLLRGGLLCGAVAGWCLGLRHSPLSVAVVVAFAMPFFVLILSRMFLGERISPLRWSATALGFLGVAVMAEPWHGGLHWSIPALLLADLLFASLDVLNKKLASAEPMGTLLFYTALATALFAAPPAILSWQPLPPLFWICAASLGIGANLLLFCHVRALRLLEASATAPYRYLEFVLSIGTGYLFFGDAPGGSTFLGAAIIIPTTLFLSCREGRQIPPRLSPEPQEHTP